MKIRELKVKDAPYMLEWMHDNNVIENLHANFKSKNLNDCKNFISKSKGSKNNINLAIVDDFDTYMGTVSLKNIDFIAQTAEFAISIRSCAMGKGYSSFAMKQILKYGIETLGLTNIYWCVSKKNTRAIRFYNKNMYSVTNNIPQKLMDAYTNDNSLIWYRY